MKNLTKKLFWVFLICVTYANVLTAQRIYVDGADLKVNGSEIFLNGSNTPWIAWNDFGIGRFDYAKWDLEFQKLEDHKVNSTRVWISCNGEENPLQLTSDGYVNGPTDAFLKDLDKLVEIATKHRVYLMFALISFDHTIDGNPHYDKWRKMYASEDNMDSFVENYAVEVATRYSNNPYVFSFDVCNEIMWVSESENNDRGNYEWANLQYLVGKTAQRVHEVSDVLVCVSNYLKYIGSDYQGNKWSDEALQAQVNDTDAYVDFYKIHYYSWVHQWFGGFHFDYTPQELGIGDKPCITGEITAKGGYDGNNTRVYTTAQYYEKHLQKGWSGCMPWTSNGVDVNGSIDGPHGEGTRSFWVNHPELVYPLGSPCKVAPRKTSVTVGKPDAAIVNIPVLADSAVNVSTTGDWLTASFANNMLTIEVLENTEINKRIDTVVLQSCETRYIKVTQLSAGIPSEDAIQVISYPSVAEKGQDIMVRVDFAAVTGGDKVRVDLFNNFTSWTWYAGTQLDIEAPEAGTHNFVLSIPGDLGPGDYKLFVNIKDGDVDVIDTSADLEVVESLPVPAKDTVFITSSPSHAFPGDKIPVDIDYELLSEANILRIDMYDNLTDRNWVSGTQVSSTTLSAGSYHFKLSVPKQTVPGDYKLYANLRHGDEGIVAYSTDITIDTPIVVVTGVRISNCPSSSLEVDDTHDLNATVVPWNATDNSVTWSSSDEDIAAVDASTGEVTAVAVGTATITVTTNDGGHTATCDIVVDDDNSIALASISQSLKVYPNPVDKGVVFVEAETGGSTLEIYNLQGRLMFKMPVLSKGTYQINTTNFGKGVYILRLHGKATKLMVKE